MSTARRPHFYLSAPHSNLDTRLVYGHKLPNRFATKAEALQVAREVLGLDVATVWYADSKGTQRKVAELTGAVCA